MLLFSPSVVSDSLGPQGLQPTRLLCSWDSPGKNTEWVAISFSRDLPDPGIEPGSPAWQGAFFTTEPQGRSAMNMGVPISAHVPLFNSLGYIPRKRIGLFGDSVFNFFRNCHITLFFLTSS